MSLERRLIAAVFLVLLASLLVGAALTYAHAAHKVQTEMEAALAVGQRVVQNAVDDGEEQVSPARRVALVVGDFNGDRHLRALVTDDRGRTVMSSALQAPEDPAPQVFFDLINRAPVIADIALPPALRGLGHFRLETDAHNEVSEAWGDLKLSFCILAVFFCLVLGLIVGTVRSALRPLQALCDALIRVGAGDYRTRLALGDFRELEPVQQGFNGMAGRLEDMETQNRTLQTRVQCVQEEERAELARDLHDEVAPFLFAVSADAALIRQCIVAGHVADIDDRARGILESVSHMQKHLREVLSRLMPDVLLDLGLPGAIDSLVHFWQARRPDVAFIVDVSEQTLDDRTSSVVFRVVQEGLSNAMRHAQPSTVRITVNQGPDEVDVEISDDGRGLPPGLLNQGFGLLGMRERVRSLGGQLDVGPAPGGHGVTVHAVLGHARRQVATT